MRVFITALAIPTFALGIGIAVGELTKDPVPALAPTSIIWADRVYVSKGDLSRWLKARGATYDAWALRHPASAATLEGRPAPPRALSASAEPTRPAKQGGVAIVLLLASAGGLAAVVVALRTMRRRLVRALRRPWRRSRSSAESAPPRRMPRRPTWGALQHAAAVSVAASRQSVGWLDSRRAQLKRPDVDAAAWRGRARLPEFLRYRASDLAFAAMSVLLAIVVAASLVLYLS